MIRTPSDFIAYLRYISAQHPLVAHVIHGEEIRTEGATQSGVKYPLVDIEVPTHTIPVGADPTVMSTRIFVTDISTQNTAAQDISHDRSHHIAIHLIASIKAHAGDPQWGFALASRIELRPMVSLTSDNARGWTFELAIEVDQYMCLDMPLVPDDLMFAQFRWVNNSAEDPTAVDIAVSSTSIGSGATLTWYWQDSVAHTAPEAVADDALQLAADETVTHRVVKVWMRMVRGSTTLWSYAVIDTRQASGYSVPFTPYLPI